MGLVAMRDYLITTRVKGDYSKEQARLRGIMGTRKHGNGMAVQELTTCSSGGYHFKAEIFEISTKPGEGINVQTRVKVQCPSC